MTIAVLDYSTGTVDIINDCPNLRTNEEVENYLSEVLEYNIDEIHFMFSRVEIETNTLTPDDFAIDEEHAQRYNVIADIQTKHREFMEKEGYAPLYVNCRIRFIDDEERQNVVIKMTTEKDEKDDDIFFYCAGIDDLVRLCYVDTEDFDLIDVFDFTDEI